VSISQFVTVLITFWNSRRRPSTILDHPRSHCFEPHQPVKFYANPIHSFEDMWIWFFLQIWLKMPIHAPQNLGLLEVWTLKRHWSSSRPQKAHPWTEPHLHAIFGTDPSTGATCAQGEGIKKKRKKGEERNLLWQTGCSHIQPTLTSGLAFRVVFWM